MPTFRNIIFDLGGVILNIDFAKTTDAFVDLGIKNFHELYSQEHASPLFKKLECGEAPRQEFVDEIKKYTPEELTDEQIINAWNAILINFPPERIALLKNLKSQYRTFLLSNTNAIHYEKFSEMYRERAGGGSLEDCFEKAYYSHLMGVRKPAKEAFEWVIRENGLQPGETLFIDDTTSNIEAAAALGLQTLHLLPSQELTEVLQGG